MSTDTRQGEPEREGAGRPEPGATVPSEQVGPAAGGEDRGGTTGADASMAEVLAGLRAGDRSATGVFIERYGPMVRRRVRGKLGASMRRLFDSQDILSTVSRRLDMYVASGRVRAQSEAELWSLVFRIVDAALVDKIRLIKRLRRIGEPGAAGAADRADGELARALLVRLQPTGEAAPADDHAEEVLQRAFAALSEAADRQMLSLWLRGHRHTVIATVLGITHDAARQRWVSVRTKLRRELGTEEGG